MSAGARLRRLLERPGVLVAPGVYDGISARLAEDAGFQCLYVSGAATAMSLLGQPDIGLTTLTEMAGAVRRIVARTEIPVIADADTGFGNHLNVRRTVEEFEAAGAAGIHMEDQVFPKRCGHFAHKEVVPTREFELKIRAAVRCRTDPQFVIIARTDARGPLGLDAAVDRANRYSRAGADLIFVEAPESEDEVREIAAQVDAPLVFNVVASGRTPWIGLDTLERLNYRIALVPGVALIAATAAIDAAMAHLLASGTLPSYMSEHAPKTLFERVGLREWERFDSELRAPEEDP